MTSPAQLPQSDVAERSLTFIDKVNIAQHLLNNENWNSIAERFGTSLLKVNQLSENFHVILETFRYYIQSQEMPLRSGLYPRMENILFTWYGEQHGNVTNKALGDKAKEIIEVLSERPTQNSVKFSGTNNWANKFRARFNLPVSTRHKTVNFPVQAPNTVDAALNAAVYAAALNAAVLNAALHSTSMQQGHQGADDVVFVVSSDEENGTGLGDSGQKGNELKEVKFKTEVEDFQVNVNPSPILQPGENFDTELKLFLYRASQV